LLINLAYDFSHLPSTPTNSTQSAYSVGKVRFLEAIEEIFASYRIDIRKDYFVPSPHLRMPRQELVNRLNAIDRFLEEKKDVEPGDPLFILVLYAEGVRHALRALKKIFRLSHG